VTYQVEVSIAAQRQLKKLPKSERPLITATIEALANNPRPSGVVKMEGEADTYRVRVKNYRVVYEIQDKQLLVVVIRIGHRRDVYRKK
jgi:mRNA interferase RelE/StbE